MKKILSFVLVTFYIFSLNVNAYSIVNVSNNSAKYEKQFVKKINLSKFTSKKLSILKKQIEEAIFDTENNDKMTDEKKEKLLGKLIALNNIISDEIVSREIVSSVVITIIDDKRCPSCMTKEIVDQLKQIPFFIGATFVEKDFSEAGIGDYLKQNDIKKLPAVILSTNNIKDNGEMQPYLKLLADKQFTLEIGASFDPFVNRSDKGFTILDKEVLNKIKNNTYLKGNKDAKISWIEYSDLECPYCAKLYNSDVKSQIEKIYGDKVNKYFNHFPLDFHQNAMDAARVTECIGEQKGNEGFYGLLDKSFSSENSNKDYLIEEAINLGANKDKLEKCVDDKKFDEKIKEQQSIGAYTFGIAGTPASVLINNETGEYEVISGAYPFTEFQKVIDKLLK
ncbi:thioredoxin domain-containing protein [Candidatus Gracilibacteria bacterium]|nr:thioredoxin domain-containing protein [Candidatus Gracilibacteria bacterium]